MSQEKTLKLKNILYFGIGIASLASALIYYSVIPKLTEGGFGGRAKLVSNYLQASATTTVDYLVGSATTTYIVQTGRADAAGLLIQAKASSSAVSLAFTIEHSQNGIDWYQEDCMSDVQANTSRPHANVCSHTLSLATSTNAVAGNFVRKFIKLDDLRALSTRLSFSAIQGAGTSTELWANLITREPLN